MSTKHLEQNDSHLFDFPNILPIDNSITEYRQMTVYDDTHGSGNLANVNYFSFTTQNPDVWLVIGDSYLVATIKLVKSTGVDYEKVNNEYRDKVSFDFNAANLFSEGRYYMDDQEIERMEHVGISSLLYHFQNYNRTEINSVKEARLLFPEHKHLRDYVRKCNMEVQVIIPLKTVFPLWHYTTHAFRGAKHKITLSANDALKTVFKELNDPVGQAQAAYPDDGKVQISKMVWKIPQITPSLTVQAKLETLLAKQSTFTIKWKGTSVFKIQPAKTLEIRVPLSCTIHRPTNVFVAFQKNVRSLMQRHSSMEFDHMKLVSTNVEVNGVKFPPEGDIQTNFETLHVQEAYQQFLDSCVGGNSWFENFSHYHSQYPIVHVDISRSPEGLYDESVFPNIVVNCKFEEIPTADYYMYVIITNIKESTLNLESKKMRILK